MSTAAVNDAAKGASSGNKQQQFKGNAGGKALDGARKQAASPVDGQNRRQASQPQKAWQGPNPITQRANNSSAMPNGSEKPLPKVPSQSQHKSNLESNTDKHAHDRLLFLFAHFIGKDVTLTIKNGEQFSGVFSGTSLETPAKANYILKMVKRTQLPSHQQTNGTTEILEQYIGEGEDHVMVFDMQDTAALSCSEVTTATSQAPQNGSIGSTFRTDTEISGRDPHAPRARELQRWDPGADSSMDGLALEDSGGAGWDQFAANERNFGVQSSYAEDIYTTSIDRSHPEYKRRAAEAERIAREIEGSTAGNAHVAEERRRDADRDDGQDEEEKYSGVRRDLTPLPKASTGSYVPPARRPISNTPSAPGIPFDPAIISSQLAKPSSAQPTPAPLPAILAAAAAPEKAPESVATIAPAPKAQEPVPEPAAPEPLTKEPATVPSVPLLKKENTTEDHVRGTADAFKLFANNEKLRLRQAQEAKRSSARHEKNVKLNDLKKFAENFKLKSRVPDDLVPILAKDHDKQVEIQRKADEAAREEEVRSKEREQQKTTTPSPATSATSQATTGFDPRASLPQHPRTRAAPNLRNPSLLPGSVTGSPRIPLPQRQQQQQQQALPTFHQRQGPQPLPENIRIPTGPVAPVPPMEATPLSPAARLNVNAPSFEFRPAAHNFLPTGTSPKSAAANMPVEKPSASFFDNNDTDETSGKQHADIDEDADAIKFLMEGDYTEEQKKQFAPNGGVPQPFRTPPTWSVSEDRINTSYQDTFPKPQMTSQGPSPLHTPNPAGGPMPHAHQLPPHLQASHLATPTQPQRFYPPQHGMQHGPPQGFDPRMQFPGGHGGSVQNSPRFPPAQMAAFNQQMGPQFPQMQQFPGQPMPGYGMSPNMGYRQMQAQPGQQMMMVPNQPHGNMNQMRQPFHPGPQFAPNAPQMGGQMMVQQHSQGGFMPSPMPQHAYPPMGPHPQQHMQHGGMPQHPGGPAPGYGSSPRPGAPMMQHSNSQGFHPQGGMPPHMQPQFVPSPGHQPPHGYHMQQRQLSTGGHYPQMTPRQQQAMPAGVQHAPSPGMGGPGQTQGDEGK